MAIVLSAAGCVLPMPMPFPPTKYIFMQSLLGTCYHAQHKFLFPRKNCAKQMHFSCEGGVCMHACGGERRKKTSATILRQCQAHTYAAKVQMHFRIYKSQVLYLLVLAPVDKLWNVRRRTEIISCEKCAWEIKVSKYCLAPCPPKRLRK